jgi:hypothetical protein
MLRIRHGWLVVVLAVAAVSACKKDEKTADTAAAVMGGGAAGAVSGDDLSLLPVDSEMVLGINFGQIRDSALWKQFVAPGLDKAQSQGKFEGLKDFQTKCGFDPTTSVSSISIGLRNMGGDKPDGVVVVRGLDKAKTLACVDKMNDEIKAKGTTVTKDGDVLLFKDINDGTPTGVAFINDTTAVAVGGEKGATAAGVKAVLAGSSGLKTSPAFVDLYGKLKSSDSLWFVVNGKVLDKAAMIGTRPKAAFGSLNITDGLAFDIKLRVDSADAAAQLVAKLKEQSAQVAPMVDKIDVSNDADLVKISLVLSNQKLQALVSQFGAMFGLGGLINSHP